MTSKLFGDSSNQKEKDTIINTESIGSFAANIRRPKPTNSGYIANFFGENGDDADMITALSLTKFKDLEVSVHVYCIKDAVGLSMKNPETNTYPKITTFIGKIRRPIPSDNGMTAQFFASNGENADAVNILGGSHYLDALVYVDIRIKNSKDNNEWENLNQNEINEHHAWKPSEKQKNDYKSKEKKFAKINSELQLSEILIDRNLINIINNNEKYLFTNFLKTQKCSFKPNENHSCQCNNQGNNVVAIDNTGYYYLPFCSEHLPIIKECIEKKDFNKIGGKEFYLELLNIDLIKKWIWSFFVNKFSLTGNEEPDSVKILIYLSNNNLREKLPEKFVKQALALAKTSEYIK